MLALKTIPSKIWSALKTIPSNIKSSINYILNHKLLTVGIGIIGIGVGLVFAETLYVPSEHRVPSKPVSSNSIESPSEKTEKAEEKAPAKSVLIELAETLYNSSRITDIKSIFCLGIAIVCVGIVGVVVFKPWMFRQSRIFRLSIGIIGLGVGLALAEILYVPSDRQDSTEHVESPSEKNENSEEKVPPKPVLIELVETLYSNSRITDIKAIFWLGLVLVGIGIMILGFAGGEHNMIGILGVVIAIVGITKDPSDQSLTGVGEFILPDFLNIGPAIQNLEKHISKTNEHLQDIKNGLTTDDQTIKVLQAEIVRIFQDLASQKDTVKRIKGELNNAKQAQDSVKQELDNAKQELNNAKQVQDSIKQELDNAEQAQDSIKQELNNAKQAQDSVKQELDNAKQELQEFKQAQNSVRLLTDFEDSLKSKGFLNTDRSIRWLWLKKSHNLSEYLGSSLFKMIPIGKAETLKVSPSVPIKLKRLVSHTGTLKKKKDYTVKSDSIITFINPLLGRMDVVAVVKIDKKK